MLYDNQYGWPVVAYKEIFIAAQLNALFIQKGGIANRQFN